MPETRYSLLAQQEIQRLTGHDTLDGVRMALKRAGIGAAGLQTRIGKGGWPPRKVYSASEVWDAFAGRILDHAAKDADAKEFCWAVYGPRIAASSHNQAASTVFADRL